MESGDTKNAAARSFVRSLNILLKYSRLYGFGHPRTSDHFDTAWNELHVAIPRTNESGLVLGATGSQLLLDGAAVDVTPAERSFAQLLSAAGVGSIQFTVNVQKDELEQLVRAFPTQNTKAAGLAERLKTALGQTTGIRINEIRFVAEDEAMTESRVAAQLAGRTLGVDSGAIKDWLRDPQKLLQLIAAAEGSRGGPAGPGTGSGPGAGTGSGGTEGATGGGSGKSGPNATGSGFAGGSGGGSGTVGAGSIAGSAGKGGPGDTGSGFAGGSGGTGTGSPRAGGNGGGTGGASGTGASAGTIGTGFAGGPGGSETGTAGGGTGSAGGTSGTGAFGSGFAGGSGGTGEAQGGGAGSPWSAQDEDILGILRLLTHLGSTVTGDGNVQPGPLHEQLTKLPQQSQEMLRQALSAIAAQTPATNKNDPMLLRLAEHLAIRFALERYQRGDVKVDAVRQMIDRMSQEIEGLRKILGAHEEKMADSGIFVESHADLLDRQFWAAVPEKGKHVVLSSSDAWCIPSRNVKQYVEELLARGDEKQAIAILKNYVACLQSTEFEARRRTAIGLAELAELYASTSGKLLAGAIQIAGSQLSLERDESLQGLISAAFVRLAQEAGTRRIFPAMLQALDSVDAVEHQRPVFAQTMRPRIGLEKRVPSLIEEALRTDRSPEGLSALLQRVPRSAAESVVLRFNRTGNRTEMQRLVDLAKEIGEDCAASLRDTLRSGSANEAAEVTGLLSRLDAGSIERWMPERLREWPRNAQDRAVRLVAMGGANERGWLLTSLLDALDALLLPLAIDEIGLTEDATCTQPLIRLAEGDASRPRGDFLRLKAIEALGRLKAQPSADLLRSIAETRTMFRWANPSELRLAAMLSLGKIDPQWARDFMPRSGFSSADLYLAPLDPKPSAKYFRQRRYVRVRLAQPMPATATVGSESYRLELRGLSLSGGIASGEKHLQPGTLVAMKIGSQLRPIRAQVLMRDARAQGLGFEFADMDLDERARLRKILMENMSGSIPVQSEVLTPTSA